MRFNYKISKVRSGPEHVGGSAPFRVCPWMPLVQISAQLPWVYGALPTLKAGTGTGWRLGTLEASLSPLSVPNLCFCAPFPPRAGWEQQQQLLVPGGSWYRKDQGWSDGSGVGEEEGADNKQQPGRMVFPW